MTAGIIIKAKDGYIMGSDCLVVSISREKMYLDSKIKQTSLQDIQLLSCVAGIQYISNSDGLDQKLHNFVKEYPQDILNIFSSKIDYSSDYNPSKLYKLKKEFDSMDRFFELHPQFNTPLALLDIQSRREYTRELPLAQQAYKKKIESKIKKIQIDEMCQDVLGSVYQDQKILFLLSKKEVYQKIGIIHDKKITEIDENHVIGYAKNLIDEKLFKIPKNLSLPDAFKEMKNLLNLCLKEKKLFEGYTIKVLNQIDNTVQTFEDKSANLIPDSLEYVN